MLSGMADSGSAPRRRGRPRKGQSGDTRTRIAEAAAAEFSDKGYDATSMRGIARRAQVDAALVHHYFETKAVLFAEVVKLPVRPDRIIAAALDAPFPELGGSIVRTVLLAWEDPKLKHVGVTVLRSVVTGSAAGRLIRQFLLRELMSAVAERIEGSGIDAEEARRRASMVISQIAGVLILRHVVEVEPLVSQPIEGVIAATIPAVQGHIEGVRTDD